MHERLGADPIRAPSAERELAKRVGTTGKRAAAAEEEEEKGERDAAAVV